jgi:DNA-binding IclR family transcriptional regulator
MSKIVGRTLDFIELFADQKRALSLSDISRLLDLPPSSCHDVLGELKDRGYVYELTPRGGYYPTLRIYEIGKTISDHDPVVARAELLLRETRDAIGESVLLAKASGLEATYLLAFDPQNALGVRRKVGENIFGLHTTSAGKALLGSLSEAALSNFLLSAPLVAATPLTITSKKKLRKDIEDGNRRGWFLNRQESQIGVTTLSARFHWLSTLFIVSIAGPSHRVEPRLEEFAKLLISVCQKLSEPK